MHAHVHALGSPCLSSHTTFLLSFPSQLRPLAEVLNVGSASSSSVAALSQTLATYDWPAVSAAVHVLKEGHFLAAGFQKRFPDNAGNAVLRQDSKDTNRKAGEALRGQWGAYILDPDRCVPLWRCRAPSFQ